LDYENIMQKIEKSILAKEEAIESEENDNEKS
jgi:hypothetical protein